MNTFGLPGPQIGISLTNPFFCHDLLFELCYVIGILCDSLLVLVICFATIVTGCDLMFLYCDLTHENKMRHQASGLNDVKKKEKGRL